MPKYADPSFMNELEAEFWSPGQHRIREIVNARIPDYLAGDSPSEWESLFREVRHAFAVDPMISTDPITAQPLGYYKVAATTQPNKIHRQPVIQFNGSRADGCFAMNSHCSRSLSFQRPLQRKPKPNHLSPTRIATRTYKARMREISYRMLYTPVLSS